MLILDLPDAQRCEAIGFWLSDQIAFGQQLCIIDQDNRVNGMAAGCDRGNMLLQLDQKRYGAPTGFQTELFGNDLKQGDALQAAIMNVQSLVIVGIQTR